MPQPSDYRPLTCAQCREGLGLDFTFSMAFQPIVNTTTGVVFAQEALVRGLDNEPASHIFSFVNDTNRYRFDQGCRVEAIRLAASLGVESALSINFLPNAVYRPELCIRTTLEAAATYSFPIDRIIFEITEIERVTDNRHLREIVEYYQQRGFKTALDDFGAGYAGLNLLAEFQTDFVKLDMALVRGLNADRPRRAIVNSIVRLCRELHIEPIAEGVETGEELAVLQDFGVELFQGYYFARPTFQSLASL